MSIANVAAAVVPWTRSDPKRKGKGSGLETSDPCDNADARRPLLKVDLTSKQSFGSAVTPQSYGAAAGPVPRPLASSPERYRRDSALDRVPEEATGLLESGAETEGDEEWDLEAQGFYTGSYRIAVAWFSFVPLTSLLVFIGLSILPHFVWPSERHSPSNNTRYFPFPLPETLVAAALWSFSHLIRDPIFTVISKFITRELSNAIVFNAIHITLTQLLRISALAILRIRHQMDFPLPTSEDAAFQRVWWIALGWSLAEVSAGIAQGYSHLALYRNVMLPPERIQEILTKSKIVGSSDEFLPLSPETIRPSDVSKGVSCSGTVIGSDGRRASFQEEPEEEIESEVDEDFQQLIEINDREELEEIYGIPFIKIPVFVSCLQRVDSILINLGLTLVLAASYIQSPLSFPNEPISPIYHNRVLFIMFPVVALLHLVLSLLHTPPLLPRLGVHTTAYVGFMVGLGSVFAGLAFWGALS